MLDFSPCCPCDLMKSVLHACSAQVTEESFINENLWPTFVSPECKSLTSHYDLKLGPQIFHACAEKPAELRATLRPKHKVIFMRQCALGQFLAEYYIADQLRSVLRLMPVPQVPSLTRAFLPIPLCMYQAACRIPMHESPPHFDCAVPSGLARPCAVHRATPDFRPDGAFACQKYQESRIEPLLGGFLKFCMMAS